MFVLLSCYVICYMYAIFLFSRKPETLVESCLTSEENMVEKLRPDELASFREAFDTFDKNSDGTISTKVALRGSRNFQILQYCRNCMRLCDEQDRTPQSQKFKI